MHIHVAHADGEAKFWLEPDVSLAGHTGLSATVLSAAEDAVVRHLQESKDAWNNHFGR